MIQKFINGNIVMNGESAQDSLADFSSLHLQSVRRLHITIEVLDAQNNTLEVLQGLSTAGNIENNGTSLVRRTGSLTFVLKDKFVPNPESPIWMTNKIRVYAGIDNMKAQDYKPTHFCLGTFFIAEPSVTVSPDNRSITIELQDRMAMWENTQFENKIVIEPETPVHVAFQMILSVNGETQFSYIQETAETVPYQIEFAQGSSVLEALTTLSSLYMDWEAYYNTEGFLVYKKMDIQYNRETLPQWVYDEKSPLLLSFDEAFTYKGVKNRIVVFGGMDEKTGITPRSQADLIPTATLGANNIGVKKSVIVEPSYIQKEQCDAKAKFELWKSSTLQESVTISSVPIYFLDSNDLIEVWNPTTRKMERYAITGISFGLSHTDAMQIQARKVYYDDVLMDTHDKSVDYLINMITNKGWLSIPEARIKQYYGLSGDGSTLNINFEHNQVGGTTAYVTGYHGTTTQTMTIDLVDLGTGTGDSGDNPLSSKGDYTDRILGHEMLHAVMNNSFGIAKTAVMPQWFREGVAEFLHGADERLKLVIAEDGAINEGRLKHLIQRGTSLLRVNDWTSQTTDYSAGYIIIKYLDKKLSSGKDMKSLMAHIKASKKDGDVAIRDAIVANTGFSTYNAFVADFEKNGAAFVKTNVTLNMLGDEVDTGSIGGSDHRGTVPLNAETVFDNSKAVAGRIATGFKVQFERP